MSYSTVPLEDFKSVFSTAIGTPVVSLITPPLLITPNQELSSVALGGRVVAVSDDFFAEAFHLLLVEPAPSLKGQFGPKGALFSGWESRRHNPTYDWCIIELGTTGSITGFDIDTSHFNGNEAPRLLSISSTRLMWEELLSKVNLGPSSRHLFTVPASKGANYVKLNMYPDGGIARFRVYGLVAPVFPTDPSAVFDLAHVFCGGRVVFTSDQHFGEGSNLILPGRGKDMGDGWETKRSRAPGHMDWAIIKLWVTSAFFPPCHPRVTLNSHFPRLPPRSLRTAPHRLPIASCAPGFLAQAEIDTAHFKGNFPESCELHALHSDTLAPTDVPDDAWTPILPRTKLGPHRQHFFQLENVNGTPYTHVKLTIYPDGGVKRVRLRGMRADAGAAVGAVDAPGPALSALPLTPEAFAPFGHVVQAYADVHAVPSPRTVRVTGANQGTATKFHKLAPVEASYPADAGAGAALSIYRCKPIDVAPGGEWPVKLLERHPCTNQAFYLVIVAKNGADDKPDLGSMRAFIASAGQGIVYSTGIWHHPMAALYKTMDFTCVETQIGNGDPLDCEIVDLDGSTGYYRVQLPVQI
ncbi:allantoicase [Epithele typhae]|uniref:allantoicase n=1 Tax=Epithele typhae TaxID=378194 RepID=UPI002007A1D0|nr:allantoicase [Epithele typhae]KAH9931066.1 allantoicase [Epithele typhae]